MTFVRLKVFDINTGTFTVTWLLSLPWQGFSYRYKNT